MANPQIKLKRSSTQNKRPTPENVPLGELALNTYDGYLYASKNVGVGTTVITVNPWRVGTGTDSYNIDFTAGNVGINSASPTALLDVNGDVNISGVVTATSFDGNLTGFDELTAPHSSTTKNYTVTVASKSDHRYQGTGSGNAYYIDGVESPILHLTPGRTYRFTLSSGDMSSHPFRFYLEADKTTQYTTDVTTTSTYAEITITDSTPAVIHYQCSSHGYMGNAIITHSNAVNTPYLITGLNGANITGVVTATSFSGTATTATSVTLADESTDTICYPIFATDATGDQEPKTDASNLLYNSNTGALTADSFFGDGSTLTNVLSNVSEDTTPQLGGPLDINSNNITGTGNIDITGSLDVSGIASVGSAITMYGSTGIVSATEYYGDGSNLSSIVTQLTAGTGIVLNQTTGNVTITASGGGDADPTTRTTTRFVATASQSSFTVSYSVGYVDVFLNGSKLDSTEYTATNGTSVSLTTAAAADDIVEIVAYESVGIVSITSATQGLDVTGHLETDTFNSSGIVTAASGIDAIGIQSGGVNIADGVITALNFIGAGNTFALNGTVVDISIAGGGGGISSIADDTSPQLGGDLDLNDQDITGTGNINLTGVVTATSGIDAIGIQSGGVNIATGIITALNFIGAGNTIAVNGTVVDISIAGGGGSIAGINTTGTSYFNNIDLSGDIVIADKIIHRGDTNTAIRFPADDTISLELSGSERLRVDSLGKIGIGTNNPYYKIDFGKANTSASVRIPTNSNNPAFYTHGITSNTDNTIIRITSTPADLAAVNSDYGFSVKYMGTRAGNNNSLSIFSDNQNAESQIEAITIQQDGSVGFNSTTPTARLDVNGDVNISGVITATTFDVGASSNSFKILDDNGTGEIRSDTFAIRDAGDTLNKMFFGSSGTGHVVRLYADGNEKLSTTSSGIFVQDTIQVGSAITASSGIITALSGIDAIGIQSGGETIADGVITALNFIGAGNTIAVNGTVVDISIAGGGGGDTVTINATATDILSVSSGDISADDAGADKLVFWDDSESKLTYLTAGSGLSISGTTITATGGGGSSGIEIENSGTSVGTAITAINFNTNLIATASGGIATITASGGGVGGNPVSKSSTETTATGGQTVFNGTYTVGFVDVFLNGSKLDSSEFTATNGTSITLTTGATENDIIEVIGFTFADGSTNIELSNDSSPELAANLDLKGFDIVDSVGGSQLPGQIDALEIMLFT